MSGSHSLTASEATEYEAIEATVSGSARGRWFLAEHARRSRGAETGVLLGAMARLESVVLQGHGQQSIGRFRVDLMEMAGAIGRTRAEIAAVADLDPARPSTGAQPHDAVARVAERAATDIFGAAEQVQESAWTLRERGVDADMCDALDRHATQIYAACSFQELAARRTGRIAQTLRDLEERVLAMIAVCDAGDARARPADAGPPADPHRGDADRYLDMDGPRALAATTAALRAIEPGAVPLHDDIVFLPALTAPEPFSAGAGQGWAGAEQDWADAFEADVAAEEHALEEHASQGEAFKTDALKTDALETASDDAPPAQPDHAGLPPVERPRSLAEIDALSVEEKLALFC